MSQDIETLRAFVDAFNKNDFEDAVRYLHPEVEIYPAIGGQLDVNRRYRGQLRGPDRGPRNSRPG
jgi:hypothetical protein